MYTECSEINESKSYCTIFEKLNKKVMCTFLFQAIVLRNKGLNIANYRLRLDDHLSINRACGNLAL